MSGFSQNLTLDELADWAGQTAVNLRDPQFRKPLEACKRLLANAFKQNFAGQHDPAGNPWPPLKHPPYEGKAILWTTGHLMQSTGAGEGHVEELSKDELIFGTNLVYAAIQQYGGTINLPERKAPTSRGKSVFAFPGPDGKTIFTKRIRATSVTIPPRPFIGVSEDLANQIGEEFSKWLDTEMET